MITFEKFSQRLAHGQLKNTSAVDDTYKDEIDSAYLPTVLDLTNQGLVDLSTRFPLITRQVDLVFQPDQHVYKLNSANVGSFLIDTDTDPFEDNFVKILDIFDEDGCRYTHDTNGHIMTPTYDTLRFSKSIMEDLGDKVRVRYQAKHPTIGLEDNIDIPPNLVTGLQLFVASLYISHMNGPDHTIKGDSYFAAYLRHIGEDETRNTSSTSEVNLDTRFCDRGFI